MPVCGYSQSTSAKLSEKNLFSTSDSIASGCAYRRSMLLSSGAYVVVLLVLGPVRTLWRTQTAQMLADCTKTGKDPASRGNSPSDTLTTQASTAKAMKKTNGE